MPPITAVFSNNLTFVYELLDFDRFILDSYVAGFEDWATELDKSGNRVMASNVRNRMLSLRNIRDHDSLKSRYETIYNQCVVLLVSHFGSAVHAIFRNAVKRALMHPSEVPVQSHKIETRWVDLQNADDAPPALVFAELLIAQEDLSFQDMQSVTRAFQKHLEIDIPRGELQNDIIFGQAARHVIVHFGSLVDKRMIRQVSGATPRTLKQQITPNTHLHFESDEVKSLGQTMEGYVSLLSQLVDEHFPRAASEADKGTDLATQG